MIRIPDPTLLNVLTEWEPPKVPHCSNCLYCTVGGSPLDPTVSCAQAHGRANVPLWRLIRRQRPVGFRAAISCPDFRSMSDEDAI